MSEQQRSLAFASALGGIVVATCWLRAQLTRAKSKKWPNGQRYHAAVASTDLELQEMRKQKWALYPKHEEPPRSACLAGRTVLLRAGLTLTPYANSTACSANCGFCSQELARSSPEGNVGWRESSKDLPPPADYDAYFKGLADFFQDLRTSRVQVGLSLSGLEVSTEPIFFQRLMRAIREFRDIFDELVVYTNASGFISDELVLELKSADFDRVELSRHHFDASANQKIMRFARGVAVRDAKVYEAVVGKLVTATRCLLHHCLLNRAGISTVEDVEKYVIWSRELGISHILFQELSRLDYGIHAENAVSRYIEDKRISVESIMEQVAPTLQDRLLLLLRDVLLRWL